MSANLFGRSSETSTTQRVSFGVRAHSDISELMRRSTSALRCALFRWTYPWPVAYGFLCELRSFLHRILSLRTLYENGLDLGPLVEPREHETKMPCDRTRGRMLGTQRLRKEREWVSLGDLQVFLEGWEQGARWASSHGERQNFYTIQQERKPSS